MADVPGGASGLLCRDYKGKEADQMVKRFDPGVVLLVAELRGHERQAAEEVGQLERRGAQGGRRLASGGDAGRGWWRDLREWNRAVAGGAADGRSEPQQIPSAGTWI